MLGAGRYQRGERAGERWRGRIVWRPPVLGLAGCFCLTPTWHPRSDHVELPRKGTWPQGNSTDTLLPGKGNYMAVSALGGVSR
ncbi:hypothetical protein NDU88_001033 [Pleurodeles waltl]|uniref:Uncharacterized protein n=1 Tax=Pleurodeles waltl TaxID=8319 RepID=A0AAV7NDZ4_PLEWA|nr:hypothetical protein NDU88_001033 [Pleurodeles waltl]